MPFLIYKDDPAAIIPTRGSLGAAGYDLSSIEHKIVPARGSALISTGLRMQFPDDCFGHILPRSGLAVKHGIHVGAGVGDSDYRGVYHVMLFNHKDEDFEVMPGDRIAQLVLQRIYLPKWQEVASLEEFEATARGDAGFGSTGIGAA